MCKTDIAEATKRAVDGDLIRWRERVQKKDAPFTKTLELLMSGKNNASASFVEIKSLNFQAFSELLIVNSHPEKQGGIGSTVAPLSLNKKRSRLSPVLDDFLGKRKMYVVPTLQFSIIDEVSQRLSACLLWLYFLLVSL